MPKQTRAKDPASEDQKRSARRQAEQAPAATSAADAGRLQRLLKSHSVQARLEVGPANDHYEQEADRVAQQVMRMPADTAKEDDEEKP